MKRTSLSPLLLLAALAATGCVEFADGVNYIENNIIGQITGSLRNSSVLEISGEYLTRGDTISCMHGRTMSRPTVQEKNGRLEVTVKGKPGPSLAAAGWKTDISLEGDTYIIHGAIPEEQCGPAAPRGAAYVFSTLEEGISLKRFSSVIELTVNDSETSSVRITAADGTPIAGNLILPGWEADAESVTLRIEGAGSYRAEILSGCYRDGLIVESFSADGHLAGTYNTERNLDLTGNGVFSIGTIGGSAETTPPDEPGETIDEPQEPDEPEIPETPADPDDEPDDIPDTPSEPDVPETPGTGDPEEPVTPDNPGTGEPDEPDVPVVDEPQEPDSTPQEPDEPESPDGGEEQQPDVPGEGGESTPPDGPENNDEPGEEEPQYVYEENRNLAITGIPAKVMYGSKVTCKAMLDGRMLPSRVESGDRSVTTDGSSFTIRANGPHSLKIVAEADSHTSYWKDFSVTVYDKADVHMMIVSKGGGDNTYGNSQVVLRCSSVQPVRITFGVKANAKPLIGSLKSEWMFEKKTITLNPGQDYYLADYASLADWVKKHLAATLSLDLYLTVDDKYMDVNFNAENIQENLKKAGKAVEVRLNGRKLW